MDRTRCGAQSVVRSLEGRYVNLGAILSPLMTPDDNDNFKQNDRQVNLYKLILMGQHILLWSPLKY
jgi:hypothetical protein